MSNRYANNSRANRTRTHSRGSVANRKICSATNGKILHSSNTNPTPPSKPRLPSNTRIGMVWAQSLNGVIGRDGDMPWHVPEDLQHFKRVTMGEVLVMGRKTWSSFPNSVRPLPGRTSVVVSGTFAEDPSDLKLHEDGVHVAADLETGLELAGELKTGHNIWVIGGGSLYAQALGLATVGERRAC